jgi:hypothetical protein
MSHELIYTSAPEGLKPGSKGFCTVAMTANMAVALAERLESLSGYRPVAGGAQANGTPVAWAHWRLSLQGRTRSVLSRVCDAGFDYTQRTNKFAHHLVLEPGEQCEAGPAWLLSQSQLFETSWSGAPRLIPVGRNIPRGTRRPGICRAWEAATGDAGWGGVLAEQATKDLNKPAYIIFKPGTNVLALFEEALSLVPPSIRWQVTFSTYFTELPMGLSCHWRAVVADTPLAKDALLAGSRALVIDLTRRGAAPAGGAFVDAARTGQAVASSIKASLMPMAAPVGTPVISPLATDDDDLLDVVRPGAMKSTAVSAAAPESARYLSEPAAASVESIEPDAVPAVPASPSKILAAVDPVSPERHGMPLWAVGTLAAACLVIGVVVAAVFVSHNTPPVPDPSSGGSTMVSGLPAPVAGGVKITPSETGGTRPESNPSPSIPGTSLTSGAPIVPATPADDQPIVVKFKSDPPALSATPGKAPAPVPARPAGFAALATLEAFPFPSRSAGSVPIALTLKADEPGVDPSVDSLSLVWPNAVGDVPAAKYEVPVGTNSKLVFKTVTTRTEHGSVLTISTSTGFTPVMLLTLTLDKNSQLQAAWTKAARGAGGGDELLQRLLYWVLQDSTLVLRNSTSGYTCKIRAVASKPAEASFVWVPGGRSVAQRFGNLPQACTVGTMQIVVPEGQSEKWDVEQEPSREPDQVAVLALSHRGPGKNVFRLMLRRDDEGAYFLESNDDFNQLKATIDQDVHDTVREKNEFEGMKNRIQELNVRIGEDTITAGDPARRVDATARIATNKQQIAFLQKEIEAWPELATRRAAIREQRARRYKDYGAMKEIVFNLEVPIGPDKNIAVARVAVKGFSAAGP